MDTGPRLCFDDDPLLEDPEALPRMPSDVAFSPRLKQPRSCAPLPLHLAVYINGARGRGGSVKWMYEDKT